MDTFHISATGLSLNYMPQYLAQALGYFAEQGLSVESYVPNPWTVVLKDLDSGSSQAVVGGIWVPLCYKGRGKEYFEFAKVSSRAPMALVAREEKKGEFRWQDLEDRIVLAPGSNSIGPAVLIKGAARENGADDTRLRIVHDYYGDMLEELYLGGMGDVLCTKSETAAALEEAGKGRVIAYLAEKAGPCPWSVYYATPECLAREDNLCGRFTLALQKAQSWLRARDGYACREVLAELWPGLDSRIGQKTIDRYLAWGMWPETVELQREELRRWEKMLAEQNHILDREIPYEEIVDPAPFHYAKEKLGL